jgi:hypothetical protein
VAAAGIPHPSADLRFASSRRIGYLRGSRSVAAEEAGILLLFVARWFAHTHRVVDSRSTRSVGAEADIVHPLVCLRIIFHLGLRYVAAEADIPHHYLRCVLTEPDTLHPSESP